LQALSDSVVTNLFNHGLVPAYRVASCVQDKKVRVRFHPVYEQFGFRCGVAAESHANVNIGR